MKVELYGDGSIRLLDSEGCLTYEGPATVLVSYGENEVDLARNFDIFEEAASQGNLDYELDEPIECLDWHLERFDGTQVMRGQSHKHHRYDSYKVIVTGGTPRGTDELGYIVDHEGGLHRPATYGLKWVYKESQA